MTLEKSRRYPARGVLHVALTLLLLLTSMGSASAESLTVTLSEATAAGTGKNVGRIELEDSKHGLLIKPDLSGLQPGPHGLHVHENPDCGPVERNGTRISAGAAGGHYDPERTGRHAGPYGDGHLGDLPNLIVEQGGTVAIPVLAPRVKIADIKTHSLMIHAGADRYTGHEHHSHGMGGTRMYCGIIK